MMDPVHPWVDPSEMRRLAEALMQAPAKQPHAPDDAGFGGDFVGYAGPQGPNPAMQQWEQTRLVSLVAPSVANRAPVEAPTQLNPEIFLESEPTPAPIAEPVAAPVVAPVEITAPPVIEAAPEVPIDRPTVRAPAALVPPPPVVNVIPPPVVFPTYQPASEPVAPAPTPAPAPVPVREEKSMPEQIAEAALRAQQVLAETLAANALVEPVRAIEPPPTMPPIVAVEPPVLSPLAVAAHPHIAAATTAPPPLMPTLTPAPPPPVHAPHASPVKVRGPFLERMSRFRDGLHGQFAAKGVFILDKEGAVIFDESDHSRLHFMARSLAMAAKKSSDGPGNVHVKVGSTTMLEVIPVDTVFGRIVLGLLVEQPLSADAVVRITHALQMAVAPPNH